MVPTPVNLTLSSDPITADWAVDLDWTEATGNGTISYRIYQHTLPITQANLLDAVLVGTTQLLGATVEVNATGTWYFAIVTVDNDGTSAPSNNVSMTAIAFPGPSPVILAQKSEVAATFNIDIRWSLVRWTKTYSLYRHASEINMSNYANATLINVFSSDVDKYLDRYPTHGRIYYAVMATGWDNSQFLSQNAMVDIIPQPFQRMWYVNKEFCAAYVRMQNPDFTADRIPDGIMDYAESDINSKISFFDIFPDSIDLNDSSDKRMRLLASYLRSAMLMIVVDRLSNLDLITWSPGQLASTMIGPTRIEMQRTMPMFFFAKGIEDGFFQLIATKTPEMISWFFVRQIANLLQTRNKQGEYEGVNFAKYQPRTSLTRRQVFQIEDTYQYNYASVMTK